MPWKTKSRILPHASIEPKFDYWAGRKTFLILAPCSDDTDIETKGFL